MGVTQLFLERYAGDAGIKLTRLGGGLLCQVTVKGLVLPGERFLRDEALWGQAPCITTQFTGSLCRLRIAFDSFCAGWKEITHLSQMESDCIEGTGQH